MMAKEIIWDISIDGVPHRVCCVPSGNKYVLYLDEEHLTNIYRLSNRRMRLGLEEPVAICGKDCLFIVWDEEPDLVVDGKMLSGQMDYQQAREKRKRACIRMSEIVMWIGGSILLASIILIAAKVIRMDNITAWDSFMLMSPIFIVWGGIQRAKWQKW